MADHHNHGRQQRASPSRTLAMATLLMLAASLLFLSGATLFASVVGVAVAMPVLLLFSPVLVPAALLVVSEGMGMAASGAMAVGAVALLSGLAKAARKAAATPPDYVEEGKRRVAELAGEKTSHVDAGQALADQAASDRRPFVGKRAL